MFVLSLLPPSAAARLGSPGEFVDYAGLNGIGRRRDEGIDGAIELLDAREESLFIEEAGIESKAALGTLAIGLSKELDPQGVLVNSVRTGLSLTEIHASSGQPDCGERLGATAPLGRAGEAGEVAEAIVWLLSDAASYTTGAILDVAGGR